MSDMTTMTAATIGGALIFGMALGLLGRLKLAVAQSAPVGDGTFRRWLMVLNITLVPLMLLSGVLIDTYGARAMLVAGSVILAMALVGLSRSRITQNAECRIKDKTSFVFCIGGATALGTASIVLMPYAFYPAANAAGLSYSTAALNLGFVFIALGALLTPVLTDILLEKIARRRTLALLALLALAPAFLGVLPDREHWQMVEPRGHPSALLAVPACWLAALVLFFYVPLEASIGLWTFSLLAERGQEERAATGLLSGFWVAFVASRLMAALAQLAFSFPRFLWERTLIVVLPLVAAVLLGNWVGAGQRGRPRGGLILLGLLLGPVLPTLLSLAFHVVPGEKGTAFGLMFAFGSVGSMVLAPFLSLRLPIVLALLVAASALVLGLIMS